MFRTDAMPDTPLHYKSITELAALLRAGETTTSRSPETNQRLAGVVDANDGCSACVDRLCGQDDPRASAHGVCHEGVTVTFGDERNEEPIPT